MKINCCSSDKITEILTKTYDHKWCREYHNRCSTVSNTTRRPVSHFVSNKGTSWIPEYFFSKVNELIKNDQTYSVALSMVFNCDIFSSNWQVLLGSFTDTLLTLWWIRSFKVDSRKLSGQSAGKHIPNIMPSPLSGLIIKQFEQIRHF